jgi:hypothetical protein
MYDLTLTSVSTSDLPNPREKMLWASGEDMLAVISSANLTLSFWKIKTTVELPGRNRLLGIPFLTNIPVPTDSGFSYSFSL